MTVLGIKKEYKKWTPVRQQNRTAEQRKNEELYGKTLATYKAGSKGDGTLMAGGSDWRNL